MSVSTTLSGVPLFSCMKNMVYLTNLIGTRHVCIFTCMPGKSVKGIV